MAGPALPVFINARHGFRVAAQAVFFDHAGPMRRKFYVVVKLSGIKANKIVHTVHGFPKEVTGKSVIGEVAVNTGNAFMGPGMKPGFIFRFHHVATAAKIRRRGFGQKLGRPKSHEQSQDRSQRPETSEIEQNLGKPGKSHRDFLPVGLAFLWKEERT
jgi:hypothetical protein